MGSFCNTWCPGCTVVSGSIKASVVHVVALTLCQPYPKRTQFYAQVKGTQCVLLFPKFYFTCRSLNLKCSQDSQLILAVDVHAVKGVTLKWAIFLNLLCFKCLYL